MSLAVTARETGDTSNLECRCLRVGGKDLGERGGDGPVTNQVGGGIVGMNGLAQKPAGRRRWGDGRGRTQIKGHRGNPRKKTKNEKSCCSIK